MMARRSDTRNQRGRTGRDDEVMARRYPSTSDGQAFSKHVLIIAKTIDKPPMWTSVCKLPLILTCAPLS